MNIVLRDCRVKRDKKRLKITPGETKNNPQVYTTQEGMQEIKGNPQVYTTQEGTKNWIHTNLYQETALCLDSFFWLKVEASTINLYNYYPLLVPECLCQARLFLTDIIAISHDISTGGISRLKCTVEDDLIYCISNKIMFWDLANPSAGFLPV